MSDYILLHTHSIMAFLLCTVAFGMLLYINRHYDGSESMRVFRIFYVGQVSWQFFDMLRYSMHPDYYGGLFYQLTVAAGTIPALSLLLWAYIQFNYLFLGDIYPRERKAVGYIMILTGIVTCTAAIWNEFFNHSDVEIFNLIGFVYGLIINLWAGMVCARKARHFQRLNQMYYSNGIGYLGLVNVLFITACVIAVIFGFYSPIGYWSFFILIWSGNLFEIIIYINYGAMYTSFKTKLIGFTFVILMSVLMIVALVFYPPLSPEEIAVSLTQQGGLTKLFWIIIIVLIIILFFLPSLLKKTLTDPLQSLLLGVQNVNNGDYTIQLPVGQPDEIGTLTTNFNEMTQTLKKSKEDLVKYAENLEEKVSQRTEQLQDSLIKLHETQNQLIQNEKLAALGELTAGIAHEIQNPLNFVNNFSEISAELIDEMIENINSAEYTEATQLATDIKSNLEKITNHGKRADSIVKGMLQHSRTSTGILEPTNINELADEYLRLCYHGFKATDKSFNTQISTSYDKDVQKINLLPQDIGRVIMNIFSNAFYAVNDRKQQSESGYEPLVTLRTLKESKTIKIFISDNGKGMSDEVKEKIFQPFFTTKPTGKGTGLGLSLAFDIITKGHKGTINVESKIGEGSTFVISLPIG